jgi:hypothetical protein
MPRQLRRHTFLLESNTADLSLDLNTCLQGVERIEIGWVQCPAISSTLPDFLYVVESDPAGQLEGNGSANMGGMPGNPQRAFLTMPQPSSTVTTFYPGGTYPVDKRYTQPFALQTIRLRVVDAAGDPVTFGVGTPAFGIFFIVWAQ